jgi:lysine 6-dehydrogenase
MTKIVVLGAGLVGSLMARDLAEDGRFEVTAVDRSEAALGLLAGLPRLKTETKDLSSAADITRAVASANVVVGAVPGFLGAAMLRTVIAAGKPIADISFAPEDPFLLDAEAKKAGVCAIVDCGVSPGLSNLAAGRAASLFQETDSIRILVGGLPFRRVWPYEYRIVFSATDVIEEYTRPARLIDNGVVVTRPALSEVETFDFPVVGTLEGFLSDGMRTVLTTVRARRMEEKTLRYPGHAEKMRLLRETGFFGETPITVDGVSLKPRALTEKLLFSAWKLPAGEEEFTLLQVTCHGTENGRLMKRTYDLFDRTDPKTGATSMARTTGFPCTIAARLLVDGTFRTPGIHPPENLGREPKLFDAFRTGLALKGIEFSERCEPASRG